MKNTKLLLGMLALGSVAAVGCGDPVPTTDAATPRIDGGTHDSGSTIDMGVSVDANTTDAFAADVGVPVNCAGYCTEMATSCTGTNAQYTDMTACMTACTSAGWVMGTQSDTAGNTLGCRVYHSIAAAGNATLHCPHAGFLGGGVCTPFRTEDAVEGRVTTTEGAYVRVDRMGVPAVATALVGPGSAPAMVGALKDAYNDSNPDADAALASGVPVLTAIGAFHALLDDDLRTAGLTPCSVTHTFPVGTTPIPACGVQDLGGAPIGSSATAHPVAFLILPDTLRLDPTAASGFPNGRGLADDVIDPILSALLLNLSPCAGAQTGTECTGTTAATCTAAMGCSLAGTTCTPIATSRAGQCGSLTGAACNPATTGCMPAGTACVPLPCETLPAVACGATPLFAGCVASTCGTGACNVGTLGTLPNFQPHANDVPYPTGNTFPYFLPAHTS